MDDKQIQRMKILGLSALLCRCYQYVPEEDQECIEYALEDNNVNFEKTTTGIDVKV